MDDLLPLDVPLSVVVDVFDAARVRHQLGHGWVERSLSASRHVFVHELTTTVMARYSDRQWLWPAHADYARARISWWRAGR